MHVAAALALPLAISALERLAAPEAALLDPVWQRHDPGSAATVDHADWGALLATRLEVAPDGANRLDYAAFDADDRAALDAYVARLEGVDVAALARPEQLAYWINLYNAATVAVVLAHYPVESIRDIGAGLFEDGPWSRPVATVMGRTLTLDDIEHGIIRPVFAEPRIHYAVNCAAVGCPDLQPEPFRGDDLDARLAAAERAFVADPRGVRIEDGGLVLSKIWLWFRDDFAEDEAGLLEYLRGAAGGRAAAALAGRDAVDDWTYDWSLNDAR